MSGRRERRNGGDDDIDDGSWTHVSQHDQMLSHSVGLCGVTDTERTILSAVNRLALDPDVESDAMVSCAADERSCGQSVSQTGSRLNPSVRTKDDISSGLQETLSTTDSMYYVGTAGGGRSTAGETVMLTSRGSAGNWNSSFVLPVDDQRRTSNKRQSSQLHADTSPQVTFTVEYTVQTSMQLLQQRFQRRFRISTPTPCPIHSFGPPFFTVDRHHCLLCTQWCDCCCNWLHGLNARAAKGCMQ